VLFPKGEADGNPPEPNEAPGVLGFPKGDEAPKAPGADGFAKGEGKAAPGIFAAPNGVEDVFMALLLDKNGEGPGAALLPKPGVGAGVGAPDPVFVVDCALSNGLGTWYFAANFLNISGSRPWESRTSELEMQKVSIS
jgi:hypothetical protein